MKLSRIQLEHFKNYQRLDLDLSSVSLLVLVGKNGQGKTNFLEALVVLALSKSFQNQALKEMVNWYLHEEETGLPEYFRIRGDLDSQDGHHVLEVFSGRTRSYPKTLKLDDIKLRPKDYIGHLRIVLFTPQDLNMIMLAPQLRRRYINILLSQIDPAYVEHHNEYQAVLKQRNQLLKRIKEGLAKRDELSFWDEKLVHHGAYVLWKRRNIFQELNKKLSSHYESISQESVELHLVWEKDWHVDELEPFQEVFRSYLHSKIERDIDAESTCGGPHREDFYFHMNERNLADFGSRGECRSAVLALKLSELEYLTALEGDTPIVLFDDVFSELDVDRQKNLLQLFQAEQVIITTTHLDYELPDATVWEVKGGTIL